jgi:hypothetical protein
MLTYTTLTIVILTSIWAAVDSNRLQISASKKDYSWNNGSLSWLLCCFLLWIISFPYYLFTRAKVLRQRGAGSSAVTSLLGTGAVIAVLLCIAAPFLGWQRLPVDKLRERVSESIQTTWNNNPASQNIRLKSLTLVHLTGDEYSGLVVVDVSGREEQHDVEVNYDGRKFAWKLK